MTLTKRSACNLRTQPSLLMLDSGGPVYFTVGVWQLSVALCKVTVIINQIEITILTGFSDQNAGVTLVAQTRLSANCSYFALI